MSSAALNGIYSSRQIPSRPYVFVDGDDVYTSPNCSTLPAIPPHRLGLVEDTPIPKAAQMTRWADKRHPFLPYVPLSPRFDKPPLNRLTPVSKNYPVVGSGTRWRVAPATIEQFENLENNLQFIAGYLVKHSPNYMLFPLEFSLVSPPSEYGYKREHRSKFGAERAAQYSRDAFLPLMAWVSYVMSNHNYMTIPPGWAEKILMWEFVLKDSGIHPDALNELKESELVDFSVDYRRAGFILDHKDHQYHNLVRQLIRDNVPVWIYWGGVNIATRATGYGPLGSFLPKQEEISTTIRARREAEAAARAPIQATGHIIGEPPRNAEQTTKETTSSVPSTSRPLPAPMPYSGQKPGETWTDYFVRMKEKREQRLATESDAARQKRISREAAQVNHPCPGRGSSAPVVWHWKEDDDTGFRVRTRVDRAMVPDIWEQYTNSQRRFDSTLNEWDVCTELDPEAEPDIYWDDNDFDGMHVDSIRPISPQAASTPPTTLRQASLVPPLATCDSTTPAPSSPPRQPRTPSLVTPDLTMPVPSSPRSQQPTALSLVTPDSTEPAPFPQQLTVQHWRNEHAEIYGSPSTVSTLNINDQLPDILYERYGFVDPGLTNNQFSSSTNWDTVRKIFGRKDAFVEPGLHAPISHFMECMISKDRNPPVELWDLSAECISRLADNANAGLQVTQVGGSKIHYVISATNAHDNDTGWQLVLGDPATILECLRQSRTSIRQIALYLFQTGRPFSTRIRREQCQRPAQDAQPLMTLGWRLPNHRPTIYEYNYYEEIRRNFFRRPHSRAAAIAKGGIIWRLSLESTGCLNDDIVLGGPSDEVLSHGASIGPEGLWDDDVSEREMDLICGVYKVLTGESPREHHIYPFKSAY